MVMEKRISATDAVRKFSEILNSIKYKGERFTVIRGGKPVAFLSPVESPAKGRTLGELKELLRSIPRLGEEAEKFDGDLKEIFKHQPCVPKEDKWA